MKIVITMPTYRVMDVNCVQSLVAFNNVLAMQGNHVCMLFANNCMIQTGRQLLIESACKIVGADYVLCLDSDHIYDTNKFYKLVSDMEMAKLGMLSAKYYKRNYFKKPRQIAACKRFHGELQHIAPKENETGIKECDVVGFGFLLMKFDFIKNLLNKEKVLFKMDGQGEDIYFCDLVKKHGHKVCYDADVVIGHMSTIVNI